MDVLEALLPLFIGYTSIATILWLVSLMELHNANTQYRSRRQDFIDYPTTRYIRTNYLEALEERDKARRDVVLSLVWPLWAVLFLRKRREQERKLELEARMVQRDIQREERIGNIHRMQKEVEYKQRVRAAERAKIHIAFEEEFVRLMKARKKRG